MFYTYPLLQKTFSPIWIIFQNILNCIGHLGLSWRSPSKARANEVLKRLNLHQFLMAWHELFPTHKHWCRKGAGIWKLQQKKLFSYFRVVKNKFSSLLAPPLEKLLEKSISATPRKNPSDAHAHKHVKSHHFCKNLCCISPPGNTVQQHQCCKQAIAGWQMVHGVFC